MSCRVTSSHAMTVADRGEEIAGQLLIATYSEEAVAASNHPPRAATLYVDLPRACWECRETKHDRANHLKQRERMDLKEAVLKIRVPPLEKKKPGYPGFSCLIFF